MYVAQQLAHMEAVNGLSVGTSFSLYIYVDLLGWELCIPYSGIMEDEA